MELGALVERVVLTLRRGVKMALMPLVNLKQFVENKQLAYMTWYENLFHDLNAHIQLLLTTMVVRYKVVLPNDIDLYPLIKTAITNWFVSCWFLK